MTHQPTTTDDRPHSGPFLLPIPLFTTMPDYVEAHRRTYGHEPWTDRTVAPWECRPCVENGDQR